MKYYKQLYYQQNFYTLSFEHVILTFAFDDLNKNNCIFLSTFDNDFYSYISDILPNNLF